MKDKLTAAKERNPIIISFILSAMWIGIMILAGIVISLIPFIAESDSEYLGQLVVELVGTGLGIVLIKLFNYQKVFREKKYGIGKEILTSLYLIIISTVAIIINIVAVKTDSILPPWQIIIFALTMVLIGTAEEFTFRGVIANMLFDKYGKSSSGVWFSTIMTGVVFGSMHIFNAISPEISFFSALIQSIAAGVLGMVLTAIYFRTRNLWLVVFLHAFIDFGALFASGVFGINSISSFIGSFSSINLISIIPYIIVLLVLLRKKKMSEILENLELMSTNKEKVRLGIVVSALTVVISITFISGLGDLFTQSSGEVITSFTGTYINQDMADVITVPEDGNYEIVMGAQRVTEGCLIDQYFQDDEGNTYAWHLMDSGIGYFEDIELSKGNYIFKTVIITTLEEFESYIEQTKYKIDDNTMQDFKESLNKTEPAEYSVGISFKLTKQKKNDGN